MQRRLPAWTTLIASLALCVCCLTPAKCSAQTSSSFPVGLGFFHPLKADIDLGRLPSDPAAVSGYQQIHVIFINGIDPLNLGNFYGLRTFVRGQGFVNSYFGQMTSGPRFRSKIKEIRRSDPASRIVLVGYSGGTYVVRSIANDLRNDGIDVDLLVYMGGDMISNSEYSQPQNVKSILNITGHGLSVTGGNLFWNGTELDNAVNVRVPVRHILLPSQRETIQVLMNELGSVATSPLPAAGGVATVEPKSSGNQYTRRLPQQ